MLHPKDELRQLADSDEVKYVCEVETRWAEKSLSCRVG